MNAYEEGRRIHFDACVSPGNLFPFFPEFGKPFDPSGMAVKLTRWTVNLDSADTGFERAQPLSQFIGEFPRNDDRFQGKPYRHGWLLGFTGARNTLAHVDLEEGRTDVWSAPPTHPAMEPCFIPRSPEAPEGDGWIMQALTNADTRLTELNLFEATHIADGPIATVKMPLRLKPAYHGSWADSTRKERREFPFGHLYPGDLVTVKFFVTYRLRAGKIVELKSMTWAAGRGVTQLPRLGAHPSQLAAFRAYMAAFSNADFERFPRFYQNDVLLELGSVPPIRGRQAIVDFYRPMFLRVRENLMVNSVKATDSTIELDAITRFTAIVDAPDFVVGALSAGEYLEGRAIVNYVLSEGLISRISVRRGGEMRKHPRDE